MKHVKNYIKGFFKGLQIFGAILVVTQSLEGNYVALYCMWLAAWIGIATLIGQII